MTRHAVIRNAVVVAAMAGGAIFASVAAAQDFPVKPMRMIIPIGTGGDTDMIARMVSERLARQYGQPVVPENRPGAAGAVAAGFVASQPADGYTLMFANTSLFIMPAISRNLAFDAQRDFTPLATMGRTAWALLTNNEFPAKNLRELLSLVRANPGKFAYSSGGAGSTSHLSFELIKSAANLNLLHVPYKGGGEGNLAVLRNDVAMTLNNAVFARANPGRINFIAMTGDERSPGEPNTPAMKEEGVDLSIYVWMGVVAHAKTPRPIINQLNRAINDIIRSPEGADFISKKLGYEIHLQSTEQAGAFMNAEYSKWAQAVKLSGFKPSE